MCFKTALDDLCVSNLWWANEAPSVDVYIHCWAKTVWHILICWRFCRSNLFQCIPQQPVTVLWMVLPHITVCRGSPLLTRSTYQAWLEPSAHYCCYCELKKPLACGVKRLEEAAFVLALFLNIQRYSCHLFLLHRLTDIHLYTMPFLVLSMLPTACMLYCIINDSHMSSSCHFEQRAAIIKPRLTLFMLPF